MSESRRTGPVRATRSRQASVINDDASQQPSVSKRMRVEPDNNEAQANQDSDDIVAAAEADAEAESPQEPQPEVAGVPPASRGESVAAGPSPDVVQTLLNAVTQQGQVLAQLLQTRPSPQPAAAARRVPEVKLTGVTPYKGDADDALDTWVAQLDIHHDRYVDVHSVPEREFVAAVTTTLADAAVLWWRALVPAKRPKTWIAMQAAVLQQFQAVTSAERARKELKTLRQDAEQGVMEYAAKFRRLLARAGDEFQTAALQPFLTECFIDGLRDDSIRRDLDRTAPKRLDEAIEMATRLNGRLTGRAAADSSSCAAASEADGLRAQLAALTAQIDSLQKSVAANAPTRDNRRERGATKTRPAPYRVPGLLPEEARKRKLAGQCLYCGQKDHMLRDCIDRVSKKAPTLN
jgi:hypothetical protein